ncbi:hypothetical protein KBB27_01985 [Patescibacteria group bacterium]|nr:hypothetical protein [Patescibacteria group bacterium]
MQDIPLFAERPLLDEDGAFFQALSISNPREVMAALSPDARKGLEWLAEEPWIEPSERNAHEIGKVREMLTKTLGGDRVNHLRFREVSLSEEDYLSIADVLGQTGNAAYFFGIMPDEREGGSIYLIQCSEGVFNPTKVALW